MTQTERRKKLIQDLCHEHPELSNIELPQDEQEQKALLRALFNIREPRPVSREFLQIQDTYLQEELREKGITSLSDLKEEEEGIYLWQGDITTLKVDGIVNAANSQMLGCFYPNHGCIDNAIHTYAGVELRLACKKLMDEQGHEEPTGQAKITPAFNLPSQYVLHTVGPIVHGELTQKDCDLLRSCYRSCLELADLHHLNSLAFCFISTGEFHFPNKTAAQIEVETVRDYRKTTGSRIEVIFNVFKENDHNIYKRLLHTDPQTEKSA